MKTRAITAFFFTLVMLGSIFFGAATFTFFYLLLSLIALLEFYKLIKTSKVRPHEVVGTVTAAAIFLSVAAHYLGYFDNRYLLVLIPLSTAIFISELYRREAVPYAGISFTLSGLVYVTMPFCFFYALGFAFEEGTYNYHYPLAFLLMLWASDTGQYLFGRKLGKTKLFERHSPKKTWEGFMGGVFTSVLVGFLISLFFKELSAPGWMGMAVLIVGFGTLGDLVESMLKRSLQVKDSGNILPGHGGILDRFDGLLIAAPIVFAYLSLLLA